MSVIECHITTVLPKCRRPHQTCSTVHIVNCKWEKGIQISQSLLSSCQLARIRREFAVHKFWLWHLSQLRMTAQNHGPEVSHDLFSPWELDGGQSLLQTGYLVKVVLCIWSWIFKNPVFFSKNLISRLNWVIIPGNDFHGCYPNLSTQAFILP